MGYTNKHLETIKLLKDLKWEDVDIIELGSQDISMNIDKVNDFIYSLNMKPLEIKNYITNNYTRLSSKFLYDSLKVKSYTCIDIDGIHDSLKFDFNYNIKEKYGFDQQFDIVTNFGTTEHIFNQLSCFENIHNMCKLNGYIIHSLPIVGFSNHCFFNYHSTFFEHLARVNKYQLLYVSYNDGDYHDKNDSKSITIVYKKMTDEKFELPIQNKFNETLAEINYFENHFIKERIFQLTNIDLNFIKNFAIFGTGQSGSRAYKFALQLNLNIICFIDDYKTGNYAETNIPIVNFDIFMEKYHNWVELMIIGNGQTGNIDKRDNLKMEILELSNLFLTDELLKS